jgi:hypothetical protein
LRPSHNAAQEPGAPTEEIKQRALRGVEPLPVVWGVVVDTGARRDDPVGVYGGVASIVVLPDVLHVHCAADARDLIDVLGVVEQVRVFPEELLVAIEVNGINLSKRFCETNGVNLCSWKYGTYFSSVAYTNLASTKPR